MTNRVSFWSLGFVHWSFTLPVAAAGVIVKGFAAADGVVDLTIAKDFAAEDPSVDGPARESDPVPGGPARLGFLFGILNGSGLVEIDEDEVGVVADFDAAFADDIPDAGRSIAHPTNDLLD